MIILVIGLITLGIVDAVRYNHGSSIVWMLIIGILLMIYQFSITIRRLHDFNASGWWCLLGLIPFVNIWFGLLLIFLS